MTRKTLTSITVALALIAVAPNARAEIASRAYVDQGLSGKMNTMTVETTPTANSTNLVSSGGVAAAIASAITSATYDDSELQGRMDQAETDLGNAVAIAQGFNSVGGILYVDANDAIGAVKAATGNVIKNNLIAPDAAIALNKLAFPTPGNDCNTNGCMLMFHNGAYKWELITRDQNETVSGNGGTVSATPSQGNPQLWSVNPANVMAQQEI